jgi:hypothetical protein
VDRLFRYEDIDGFVAFLEDWLDCVITLPKLNVSPTASLSLSAATERRLATAMADDDALYRSIETRDPG